MATLVAVRRAGRAIALTVAGSDSSGGAGVVADLKTFESHGVWGAVAITAVTAQNTLGVQAVNLLSPELVRAQVESVVSDLGVEVVKTGLLGSAAVVEVVAAAFADLSLRPLVVDPVVGSSTGADLGGDRVTAAIAAGLVPVAAVLTPNLAEAAALLGGGTIVSRSDMAAAGRELVGRGAGAVFVTGGHADWADGSPDCLVLAGRAEPVWLEGQRLRQPNTHGTGCVLSAAIAANLALGRDVEESCRSAKVFVAAAIAAGLSLGHGAGPVDPGRSDCASGKG